MAKKILFKIKEEVIIEETRDLFPNQIDELKWVIADECQVTYDEVCVEFEDTEIIYSDNIDVSTEGLIFSDALYHNPIDGVMCQMVEGSDEFLDAILDGTIEKHLNFFI